MRTWRSSSERRPSSRRRPGEAYPFIEAEKVGQRNVGRACQLLKVSRSAYYAARNSEPGTRAREDAELTDQIKGVHRDSKGRYDATASVGCWG